MRFLVLLETTLYTTAKCSLIHPLVMANTGTEKLDRAAGLQESYFKCFSDGFGLCLNQRVRCFEKALQG